MLIESFEMISDFEKKGVFFSFQGPMTQGLMGEMGNIIKTEMQKNGASLSNICKVFSMLVEQAQNIIHYSEEVIGSCQSTDLDSLHAGAISVGFLDGHYYVIGGNRVRNDQIERIQSKLNKVKSMDKDQLKSYYREQRKKTPDQESKGAGLGFIEIVRKAGTPISYYFTQIDQTYSYFSLKSEI